MTVTIRKIRDDDEWEWAHDNNRWLDDRDHPEDYVGSMTEDALIAEVDGMRCVVNIQVPGRGEPATAICNEILKRFSTQDTPS